MKVARKLVGLELVTTFFGMVTASFYIPIDNIEDGSLMRLNIQHDQLKEMCDSRLENLYKTILTSAEIIDRHLSVFYKNRPIGFFDQSDEMDIKRCEEEGGLKTKFELLLSMVQLCMNPKDRLTDYQEEIFIRKLMKVVCKMYSLDARNNIEDGDLCMLEFAKKRDMCAKSFHKIGNILLPLKNKPEDCSESRKFFDCVEEATSVKSCTDTMRRDMKYLNNMTFYELYGCTDEDLEVDSSNDNEDMISMELASKKENIIRFPFSKPQLQEKCATKGSVFLKGLEISLAENMIIAARKQFKMTLTSRLHGLTEKEELHPLVNENCYDDAEIKKGFEKIFNAVQQCLNEEDRLDEEEKAIMLKESIRIMCYGLESSLWLIPNDRDCFNDFGIFFKKAMCNKQASSPQVYRNLPLPFVSTEQECNNIYQMQNCELDIFQECQNSTKLELKKQYNLLRKLSGCDDMYNTSEQTL